MFLSGKSRVYGLLGDPVAHSLSLLIQNHVFQVHRIDVVYVPFHVLSNDLSKTV